MPGPTIVREATTPAEASAKVLRVTAGTSAVATDELAIEEPLEINVNGWRWLVTMRTPGADADLVLGMLASEGVLRDVGEVESLVFRRHPEEPDLANVVDVQLGASLGAIQERLARNHAIASTSCGLCGASSIAAVLRQRERLAPGPEIDARVIPELPARLAAAQPGFQATGGLHAAGLFDAAGTLLAAHEDVGRHNAVDKVIGWSVRAGLPSPPLLLVSGRASFEIVQKALAASIPIVAAVSAPSSLAVDLARDAEMTLVGFVRDGGYNVYTGAERLRMQADDRDPSQTDDPLAFIPRPLRGALDEIGRKISLADWRALTRRERARLVTLCEHARRDDFAAYLVDRVRARTGAAPRELPPKPRA
jgi:FdhD protein